MCICMVVVNGVSEFCKPGLHYQASSRAVDFYCEKVSAISSIHLLREHVFHYGFRPQYHVRVWHGEEGKNIGSSGVMNDVCEEKNDLKLVDEVGDEN